MNIANPIYDSVFKQLMSNMHVVRFFIETILGEPVEDVAVHQQEIAYDKKGNPTTPGIPLALFRLDFVATIKTATGEHKKVLIEIQKTRKYVDVMRFRNYLAEHYKRQDVVYDKHGDKIEQALPIISIYLLGFKLSKIDAPAIKVNREYVDMVTHKVIKGKDDFVEQLKHDCYVVQIPRIEGRLQSVLEKLLTVFEQKYFTDETEDIKEYNYPVDDENIKRMVDLLAFACKDPESKRYLEAEREAIRVFNLAVDEDNKEKDKTIKKIDRALKARDKALKEKDKVLEEKDKALKAKDKALLENEKERKEKDKALADALKELNKLKRNLGKK